MTDPIELPALDGTNPLAFLAALGVLDVVSRAGRPAALAWTDDLVPNAVISGVGDLDELISLLDADRARWQTSVVLAGPSSHPLDDAKPAPDVHAEWAREVAATLPDGRADADLYCGLVAEGALDGNGNAKPTHLHFTAGRQQFLLMLRQLAREVDDARLHEALAGPWRDDSTLPSMSWDVGGSRPYALRARDPSKLKRTSVPGADWLAVLGLTFMPVRVVRSRSSERPPALETTGCDSGWKRSAFRWPLWSAPLSRDTVATVVADPSLVGGKVEWDRRKRRGAVAAPVMLAARGVMRVMEAPIRRTDQGGYGSFGGATTLIEAAKIQKDTS